MLEAKIQVIPPNVSKLKFNKIPFAKNANLDFYSACLDSYLTLFHLEWGNFAPPQSLSKICRKWYGRQPMTF